MNVRIFGLTALLLASAASSALAQDGGQRLWRHTAPAAPAAPQAQEAPAAPAPRTGAFQGHRQGAEDGAPPSGWSRQDRAGDRGGRGDGPREGGRDAAPAEGRRQYWSRGPEAEARMREQQQQQRWNDRRDGDRTDRRGDDRRGDDRRGDDRRWDGRRDDDRARDRDRRPEWNGDRAHDRARDRDRGGRERWTRDRYPPIYNSPSRYRAPAWRPPSGYYARSWRYGEILPRGWYGPDYRILDWWEYDLPEPPYGYEWIRNGRDVLLVDVYSGRIVQVVRLLFW